MGQSVVGVLPGLGSTAVTPLITSLLGRGHEVTLYTLSTGEVREETYRWGPLRISVGPSRRSHLARNFYHPEISFLSRTIRADAPPFVHAHWTYEFALGALRSGVPTVTTIHDLPWNVLRYFRDPHRIIRLCMAYEVGLRGTRFTAVSEYAASHFRRFIKPSARIEVIPNGLPTAIFDLGAKPVQRSHGEITFATILQGWSRLKNANAALKAFSLARREVPDARLLMFGLGFEVGGAAQQWASRHMLCTGVTFAGALPSIELLKRVHEEVDVIIHPSLDESFCMVALEGMALCKPVIAGRMTPGVREVLGLGTAGLLVDVRDSVAIAEAMVRLAQDGALRDNLAKSGHDRALANYSLDAVVTQYEGLYRNMLFAGIEAIDLRH